jgi:hypothetical protein
MTILDTQNEIGRNEQGQAPDRRFFIDSEHRPNSFILEKVKGLGHIAANSIAAKEALTEITEGEFKAYNEALSTLSRSGTKPEAMAIIGKIQGLLDTANTYEDTLSAIRRVGGDLAMHLRDNLGPSSFYNLNGRSYWIGSNRAGSRFLCGHADEDTLVYFGTLTQPQREEGREANAEDYARLIIDVETTLASDAV